MNEDRFVFLDLDGVLVTHRSWDKPWVHPRCRDASRAIVGFPALDPIPIESLNHVTRVTKAKIVISSSLRHGSDNAFQDLVDYLKSQGVDGHIIGRTPNLRWKHSGMMRGHEIDAWLNGVVPYDRIIIFDDDTDMAHLADRLIRTSLDHGLTKLQALEAIAMLGFNPMKEDARLNFKME